MKVDIATETDTDAIVCLVNAAYRGAGSVVGWTDETAILSGPRIHPSDMRKLIKKAGTTVLVARAHVANSVTGCVSVEMGQHSCGISMLAVDPALQSGGHGRALLEAAETHAAHLGASIAEMTVIQQRAALIAWYERRGYRRTGDREPFPYGDDSVGTPLRDDLVFLVLRKEIVPV